MCVPSPGRHDPPAAAANTHAGQPLHFFPKTLDYHIMQRHLEALAASLPALPGDARASSAFERSAGAIQLHLSELYE